MLAEIYVLTFYLFDHPLMRVAFVLVAGLIIFRIAVILYRLIPFNG